MKKKNNKGFLLAESLIVSTFVLTVLIYLFLQFNNLMVNHKKSYTYNSVENIYDLGSMKDYLLNNQNGKLYLGVNAYYIILYKDNSCQLDFTNKDVCNKLAEEMNLEFMIYTDSDMDTIKNHIKDNNDKFLNQDIKDFIEKLDSTKIEGKGRLIAKFKNGNFATIVFDKAETKRAIITYDFDQVNDLTKWNKLYGERFNITYDNNKKMSDITMTGGPNWEHLYIPLQTETNKEYTIKFDYQIFEHKPLDGYQGVSFQVLKEEPLYDNMDRQLAIWYLPTAKGNGTASLTFKANSNITYFVFNFGMAADYVKTHVKIGNIRYEKDITNEALYGSTLIPNINNKPIKWFSKDDIEITPLTPNSNSSQTVYGKIQY